MREPINFQNFSHLVMVECMSWCCREGQLGEIAEGITRGEVWV